MKMNMDVDMEFLITRKILQLSNRIISMRVKKMQNMDLTVSQSETLQYFYDNPGHTASDLKGHLKITHQAARNMIERMKNKGMLTVRQSQTDARNREVHLTEAGEDFCVALAKEGNDVCQVLLQDFSSQEKEQLYGMLERMFDATMRQEPAAVADSQESGE